MAIAVLSLLLAAGCPSPAPLGKVMWLLISRPAIPDRGEIVPEGGPDLVSLPVAAGMVRGAVVAAILRW